MPSRSLVEVRVSESPDCTELIIEDDGRGMPAKPGANGAAEGHFGLRMLQDLDRRGRRDPRDRLGAWKGHEGPGGDGTR